MLDRTQTIEKLKTTRQYLDEHYGVHSMTLFGSLARNEQREDSDVDICVEMVPNLLLFVCRSEQYRFILLTIFFFRPLAWRNSILPAW